MTEKQKAFTKWLFIIGIALCVVIAIVQAVTYLGTNSVSDAINAQPDRFPERFGMEIGFGMALTLIYTSITLGLFIVFLIPTALMKRASYKKGSIVKADIVLTCLLAVVSIPSFISEFSCIEVIFYALSYGIGAIWLPFVFVTFVQLAFVITCIVHLFVCRKKKDLPQNPTEAES